MFTGIIERTARVIGIAKGPAFQRITIENHWLDVQDGESIAINGVCLTVSDRAPGELMFDVVKETLARTNLGLLNESNAVHVERSLRLGDRLSGHFVQGHVDGTALLIEQGAVGKDEWRLVLECQTELAQYLTPKGSVSLDGVSLTIAAVEEEWFEVALIPETRARTTLGARLPGSHVNLEVDPLARYVLSVTLSLACPERAERVEGKGDKE